MGSACFSALFLMIPRHIFMSAPASLFIKFSCGKLEIHFFSVLHWLPSFFPEKNFFFFGGILEQNYILRDAQSNWQLNIHVFFFQRNLFFLLSYYLKRKYICYQNIMKSEKEQQQQKIIN